MSAEQERSKVLQRLEGIAQSKGRNLEIIRGHMKPRNEKVSDLINLEEGFWKSAGDYQKPRRWLFHILPGDTGFKVEFPPKTSHRVLGAISAVSDGKRKALVTFRAFPLIKTPDNKFKEYLHWEWLVWLAFKKVLPVSLGNSAVVKNLNVENGTVEVNGIAFQLSGCGIVALCPKEDVCQVVKQVEITYGAVTEKLAKLVQEDLRVTVEEVTVPTESAEPQSVVEGGN